MLEIGGLAADERGRKAIARVVRFDDRGVEIGHADHLQQRSEQFDIGALVYLGRIEDRRRQERQFLVTALHMHDRRTATAHQREEAFRQQVGRAIVDHAAHVGLRFGERFVDDQPLGERFHCRDDLVEHRIDHDQAPRGGAALARSGKGGLHDGGRRVLDLGCIEHDDRVVSAHFERHDLARVRSQLAVDRDPRARRSREQHAIDHPVLDQRLADLDTAMDALDDSLGHFRFVEAAGQEFADRRGFLAWLEDHHIARDQRGYDVAVGQVRGEVVRPQHRHHAMRLVTQSRSALQRAVELLLPGAFGIGSDRNLDLADHRFDFGPRFPQGLARFARNQFGEGFAMLAHLVGEAAHEFDPAAERFAGPLPHGLACAFDRVIDIARCSAPDFLAGCGFGGDQFGRHCAVYVLFATGYAPTWGRAGAASIQVASACGEWPAGSGGAPYAAPIARTAATLSASGRQSSFSAIAAQVASTSSISIDCGASPCQ